jgi:aspartate kinase
MARLVQKFGGTSVADVKKIRKAAEIAVKNASEGNEVAVVVSAMGHTTDHLITMAEEISDNPDAREMDMLLSTGEQVSIALMSMAIQSMGWQARSFTGQQAGIITGASHGTAKIREIRPDKVESSLKRGEIAVVAGFQGITEGNDITTLGRGGSDTTAVALAGAICAERCDIYTDVAGVYTCDPRIVPEARRLSAISYEEMLELAATGAQVMNARSIEMAMDSHVPIRVRSTFQPEDSGTLITNRLVAPEYTVCGLSLDLNQASINLKCPAQDVDAKRVEGVSSLFTRLQELNISTDMVMLLAREDEPCQEFAFTVEKRSVPRVLSIIESLGKTLGSPHIHCDTDIARISVVGRRLTSRPEVVATVFDQLSSASIPVLMVTSADLRVSIVVPASYAKEAVRLVHERFNLADVSMDFSPGPA